MAQKTLVSLIDDLDKKSEADETVAFALDGMTFEIDLTEEHADRLRNSLAPFVESARRTGGRIKRSRGITPVNTSTAKTAGNGPSGAKSKGTSKRGSAVKQDAGAIREWAKKQGYDIADRGRIPADIVERFKSAHGLR